MAGYRASLLFPNRHQGIIDFRSEEMKMSKTEYKKAPIIRHRQPNVEHCRKDIRRYFFVCGCCGSILRARY